MSSNKRRKLNIPPEPLMSAVAARRALKERTQQIISPQELPEERQDHMSSASATPIPEVSGRINDAHDSSTVENAQKVKAAQRVVICAANDDESPVSTQSREESPELPIPEPSMVFSTIKPNKGAFKQRSDGSISLRIGPGERLVILGQYGLSVLSGQITVLGSTLRPSKVVHRIFASSSHALPVVRCLATDVNDAEIQLHQCKSGLETLHSLSPLFAKLWNDGSGVLSEAYQSSVYRKGESSFRILFSSTDGPKKSFLQPLISPPKWNEVLSKLSAPRNNETSSIMLCGPKSSGKSTFTKMLGNRLLSTSAESKSNSSPPLGVAILDLDPGQPEYTPPGLLSLVHVKEYNFGPPFSHPASSSKCQIIRSHSVAAISPSLDPALYMACSLDLFAQYRTLLSKHPSLPMIINTPGWVLGTGLEILVDIITKMHPTDIIYMSQDGPPEVVRSLRDAGSKTPFYTIPSQGSEYATRTAAHLRTMQTMSYFHLDRLDGKKAVSWKSVPLTSTPPWQIRYSGSEPGILGIMCYGEQPPADVLADTITGSLVSIVVIDNFEAIPGWNQNQLEDDTHDTHDNGDLEIRVFDDEVLHPHNITKPHIVRTPDENIPYFNPANCIALDPTHSQTIGLALVRGIDIPRKRLQILTSVPSAVIEELNRLGKSIVLVSGKLDTPGWAFTEELVQKESLRKAAKHTVEEDEESSQSSESDSMDEEREEVEDDEDEVEIVVGTTSRTPGDSFHSAPWVETLHGSQGRGVGSRVWRVRRDLGRDGGNGD